MFELRLYALYITRSGHHRVFALIFDEGRGRVLVYIYTASMIQVRARGFLTFLPEGEQIYFQDSLDLQYSTVPAMDEIYYTSTILAFSYCTKEGPVNQ